MASRRESSSSPRFQSSSALEDDRSGEREFARALVFPSVKEEAGQDRLSIESVGKEP